MALLVLEILLHVLPQLPSFVGIVILFPLVGICKKSTEDSPEPQTELVGSLC